MEPKSLTLEDHSYIREIARLTAKGNGSDRVAQLLDLPRPRVDAYQRLPEFEETFRAEDPAACAAWKESKAEEVTRARLRDLAARHMESYFGVLHEVALDPTAKPEHRLAAARDLLKMGGAFKEGEQAEPLELTPAVLENLMRALQETSEPALS